MIALAGLQENDSQEDDWAMIDHGRYDYVPITRRPDFSWPDGKRLAIYIALNLEHFSFGEGLGAELAPGGPQPDVLNYAWRDYGNRVGAWRLLSLFDALDLPSSVLGPADEAALIRDSTQALTRASGEQPLVMGIALHPYIVGQPFRLPHMRRALAHLAARRDDIWFCTSGAVADHFATLFPAQFPATS